MKANRQRLRAHTSPGISRSDSRNGGSPHSTSLDHRGYGELGKVCRALGPRLVQPRILGGTREERSASTQKPCSPPSLEYKPEYKIVQFIQLGNRTFVSPLPEIYTTSRGRCGPASNSTRMASPGR